MQKEDQLEAIFDAREKDLSNRANLNREELNKEEEEECDANEALEIILYTYMYDEKDNSTTIGKIQKNLTQKMKRNKQEEEKRDEIDAKEISELRAQFYKKLRNSNNWKNTSNGGANPNKRHGPKKILNKKNPLSHAKQQIRQMLFR
ncbi:hypothetical protein RFI_31072 [Reticulomyxa filosa]|uniref:Uncharacterized protein n=1 Tax=Reticulomyxa filosa TaxID=46433 RepID=X6LXH5_RETFI|nr:hypothetical protein RFI_31072 [Reticulomyxa filosa]|eukprot:ETO06324.1 hypothetical protein RFI_31072 [Reticulomyxa filosa]